MKRGLIGVLLLVALGCSDLAGGAGTPIAIEIRFPAPPLPSIVEPHDSLVLQARALDVNGDSVQATITWLTPDTAKLILDSLTGIAMAAPDSVGTVRVQARNGSLSSDLVSLQIGPHSDTLVAVTPDSFRVQASDTSVGPFVVQLRLQNPDSGVAGGTLVFTVIDPVYPIPADRAVEFPNGPLIKVVTTDTSGGPISPVTLRRLAGKTWPDSVRLTAGWTRPSGRPVPGSPDTFVVRFK